MNKITTLINAIEGDCFKLKPVKEFPQITGISRKRWGLLVRGEKDPSLKEAQKISEIFKVELTDLLD